MLMYLKADSWPEGGHALSDSADRTEVVIHASDDSYNTKLRVGVTISAMLPVDFVEKAAETIAIQGIPWRLSVHFDIKFRGQIVSGPNEPRFECEVISDDVRHRIDSKDLGVNPISTEWHPGLQMTQDRYELVMPLDPSMIKEHFRVGVYMKLAGAWSEVRSHGRMPFLLKSSRRTDFVGYAAAKLYAGGRSHFINPRETYFTFGYYGVEYDVSFISGAEGEHAWPFHHKGGKLQGPEFHCGLVAADRLDPVRLTLFVSTLAFLLGLLAEIVFRFLPK